MIGMEGVSKVEIRLAVPNDIERVMEFYRKYWDKNHPMAVFRELMEYQHLIHGQFRYVDVYKRQTIGGGKWVKEYVDYFTIPMFLRLCL